MKALISCLESVWIEVLDLFLGFRLSDCMWPKSLSSSSSSSK